jgi:anti-anti-sigma factor
MVEKTVADGFLREGGAMCPDTVPPTVCVTLGEDTVTLTVTGELDLASRDLLEAACREAVRSTRQHLVVDMVGVTFVDCGSLALLRSTLVRASAKLGPVPVAASHRLVLKVMHLTGFSREHVVVSSAEEALRFVREPPPAQTG